MTQTKSTSLIASCSEEDKRQSSEIRLLAASQLFSGSFLVEVSNKRIDPNFTWTLFRWMKLYIKFDKIQPLNSSCHQQQTVEDFSPQVYSSTQYFFNKPKLFQHTFFVLLVIHTRALMLQLPVT